MASSVSKRQRQPTDDEHQHQQHGGGNDSNDNEEEVIYNRIKANIFFLLGSALLLPPTIADVVAINRTTPMPDHDADEGVTIVMEPPPPSTYLWYQLCFGCSMVLFLLNGIFETYIAYQAYKKTKHAEIFQRAIMSAYAERSVSFRERSESFRKAQEEGQHLLEEAPPPRPYRGDIMNGLLFTFAAFMEILSVILPSKSEHALATISACSYLFNGFLTLILRGMESRDAHAPLLLSDHLVRMGDILFLCGAILDVWAAQKDIFINLLNVHAQSLIAGLSLGSAIAWFIDAELYLIADHFLLFNNKNKPNLIQRHDDDSDTIIKDKEYVELSKHSEDTVTSDQEDDPNDLKLSPNL